MRQFKKIIFIVCFLSKVQLFSVDIYIIPPSGYENEFLFDCVEQNNQFYNRDDCVKHFYDLRTELRVLGYNLKTISLNYQIPKNSIVFTSGIPTTNILSKIRPCCSQIISFLWEPTTIEPYSYDVKNTKFIDIIFTMDDEQIDNKKYFKLYYPNPHVYMIKDKKNFSQKLLLTMIASNGIAHHNLGGELYSERRNIAKYFSDNLDQFTFYGRGGWDKNLKSFGGMVESKIETLKNYKFCICYENTKNMKGYITEKILDAFHAGCVPIYLGAPNILEYIPGDCFIDARQFSNYDEMKSFILSIDEKGYDKYISNIELFLKTDNAAKFSFQHFIKTTINAINFEKRSNHKIKI
jgi:hypothetical protein